MNKPTTILDFEKKYKLNFLQVFNKEEIKNSNIRSKNLYLLNSEDEVIGLTISRNNFEMIPDLSSFDKLKYLDLSFNLLNSLNGLEQIEFLEQIDLAYNEIREFDGLKNLTNLRCLNLTNNQIKEIKGLETLINLQELDLSSNQIFEIKGLETLTNLKLLSLFSNQIKEIKGLETLINLQELDLSSNQIFEIKGLESLTQLNELYIHGNKIALIRGIDSLRKLRILNLNTNLISEITTLIDVFKLKSLTYLNIIGNPFIEKCGIIININENHLDTIKNELRKLKDDKNDIKLPIKISLLGNHASGKSTFLEYFKSNTIEKGNSTHILNVEMIENEAFPEAVFFDFGGQDYYHGIYKAFLTDASVNMLFWHSDTDKNEIQKDSNGYNNILFNRNYWLGQIDYIEEIVFQKKENKETINKNIYQIQTHADEQTSEQNILQNHRTKRFYYISLDSKAIETNKYKHDLEALKEEIKELIANRKQEQKSTNEIKLYNYILKAKKDGNKVKVTSLLKHYNKNSNEINLLKAELDQLSKKGFVLYYKNCPDLENVVWLNVNDTVKEIHNKLDSAYLNEKKGEITQKEFEDKIEDDDIIELLKYNKVIFLDNKRRIKGEITPTYIIPSYLPYSINEEDEYFIFKNQQYDITLKFTDFIPFGFMNLLICKYGGEGEVKTYRKDNLIFTLNERKVRVMINLDFQKLIIGINIHCYENINKKEVEREIFTDILKLYNNIIEEEVETKKTKLNINNHSNEVIVLDFLILEIPKDLYVSLDGVNFVNFEKLEDKEATQNQILAYPLNEQNQIVKEKARIINTYPFKNISSNPNLKQMKKIFISYSKKDLEMVNTFQDHLSALKRDNLVNTWYCSELRAGDDWDESIKKHFDESNIICFMISPNFMKTDYIYNYEVKKAFERKKSDPSFLIVPIILDFCIWETEQENLGKYTALPYTAKPIADFTNQNAAWYIIAECLKIIIKNKVQPEGEDFYYTKEYYNNNNRLRELFERLIKHKLDA